MLPRTFHIPSLNFKKTLAGCLSLVLFLTNCALANTTESFFYSRRQNVLARLPSGQPSLFQHLPSPRAFSPIAKSQGSFGPLIQSLPLQAGTVRVLEKGGDVKRTILHVQDVHQDFEAQKNISAALQALIRTKNAPLIAVEGTSEEIDLTAFHEFPYPDIVARTADILLRKNKISGAVHASFITAKPVLIQGVEDRSLYDANVEAFRVSSRNIAVQKKRIAEAKRALAKEKAIHWNASLLGLDTTVESYRKGELPLGRYVAALDKHIAAPTTNVEIFLQASLLEDRIQFAKAEIERASVLAQLASRLTPTEIRTLTERSISYRMGRVSHADFYSHLKNLCRSHDIALGKTPAFNDYLQYVILADGIKADDLFRDLQKMEDAAYKKLIRSDIEEAGHKKSKTLYLTEKLVDFSLTSSEWEEYKTEIPFSDGADRTDRRSDDLSSFEKFYEVAEARNKALVKNLYAAMDQNKVSVAVLVTGGFHTLGIGQEFKKDGVAYASFTPRITHVSNTTGIEALSIFTQEKTPLDQIFEGQKLFLAQDPGSKAGAEAGVRVSASSLGSTPLPFAFVQKFFARTTGWTLLKFKRLVDGATQLVWRNPNGQQSAAFYANGRIQPLNTTFVLAPLMTAMNSLMLAAPFFSLETILTYLAYKLILAISIFVVESIYLHGENRLTWNNLTESLTSIGAGFVLGYDSDRLIARNLTPALAGPLFMTAIGGDDLSPVPPSQSASNAAAPNPPATPWNLGFDVNDLQKSDDVIVDAKSNALTFTKDAPFTLRKVPADLAEEFVSKALNASKNRGARAARFERRLVDDTMLFYIREKVSSDDNLNAFNRAEWNDFIERAKRQNCIVDIDQSSPQLTYTFTIPIERQAESRFQPPTPKSADDISTLLDVDFSAPQISDIVYLLRNNADRISTESLFLLLEHPAFEPEKTTVSSLLSKRLNDLSPQALTSFGPYFSRALTDNAKVPASIKISSAMALMYVVKDERLIPSSLKMIRFFDIDRETIRTSDKKTYRIEVRAELTGRVVIVVKEKQIGLFPFLRGVGRLFARVVGGKDSRPNNREGVIIFRIGEDIQDEDGPGAMETPVSNEERLRTVSFTPQDSLADEIVQLIVEKWAATTPDLTNVKIPAKRYTEAIRDAFTKNGFLLEGMGRKFHSFRKLPQPNADPSGTAQSSLGAQKTRNALFFLAPLFYLIELADEFAHIAAIWAQGFQVDWNKTNLLRWNPNVAYFTNPERPKAEAFVSLAAPLMWTLLTVLSAHLWVDNPSLYTSFHGFGSGLVALGLWYMMVGAFAQIASNITGWQRVDPTKQASLDSLTDLQRFWVQMWEPKTTGQKVAVKPLTSRYAAGGRANSSLFRVGDAFRDGVKALLLSVVSWIPGNAAATMVQDAIAPSSLSIDESEIARKTQKLVSDYQKVLRKKFPETYAAASHNYGYWYMEARAKTESNGVFIGSSLDMLTDEELSQTLTPSGIDVYTHRFKNLDKPEKKSHLLTLKHFRPEAVESFYALKLGRPEAGKIAKEILDGLVGDDFVVVDLFARTWRDGESDYASLESIKNEPNVKEAALRRQLPFTAIVMALHGTETELGISQDDLLRALWMFMKLTNYQEMESLDHAGDVLGSSFETRPKQIWERYGAQMRAILDVLPKVSGRANSSSWLHRLLYSNQPIVLPASVPAIPMDVTSQNSNMPRIKVIRGGGTGGENPPQRYFRDTLLRDLLKLENVIAARAASNPFSDGNVSPAPQTGNTASNAPADRAPQTGVASPSFPNIRTEPARLKNESSRFANPDTSVTRVTDRADSNNFDLQTGLQKRPDTDTVKDANNQTQNVSPTFSNRAFGPSAWILSIFAALGIGSLTWVSLTSANLLSSPGFSIARDALTYLTYLLGVLFVLSLIGKEGGASQPQKSKEENASLLNEVFSDSFIGRLSDEPENETPKPFTEGAPFQENAGYISRALSAIRSTPNLAVAESKSLTRPGLSSPTKAKPVDTSGTIGKRAQTQDVLRFVVEATRILSRESGQSPQSTLQDISAFQTSPNAAAVLTHTAKAGRREAILLATYRAAFRNDLLADRQIQALEATAPIGFLQFRRAALILRDELIAQMKADRDRAGRTQAGQIAILKRLLSTPRFLDKATVLLSGNKGTVATLLFNSSFHSGEPLRLEIDTRKNETPDSFSRIPENLSESDLALLSSVEAAVELLAQKKGVTKEGVLQTMVDGKLTEAEMRLIKEFAMSPLESESNMRTKPSKANSASIDGKVQSAAKFLLSELRGPRAFETGSSASAQRRLIGTAKTRYFASIATRVAASLAIASSVAVASAASHVSTPVKNGLTATSVAAIRSINPASDVRATVTPPALTRATPVLKPIEERDSSDTLILEETSHLEKLASDIVDLAQSAIGKRNSSGRINFDRVLPPVASHGVSNNNPALALQLLTEDEKADLEVLIATKIQGRLDDRRLTQDEARRLLTELFLGSELAMTMNDAIGNKDVGLPLEGGSDQQRASDVSLVSAVRANLKPSQRLILFVAPSDLPFFESTFEESIANQRVKLVASGAISTQGDKHVLDFNRLEVGLTSLDKQQLQNLVILIQDGLSWNSERLEELQALGLVGFFFTKDFMSGVPVQKMDIQFIQRLAKQLSTHA